ncbi:MAG: DUF423 domain-containing protein [Bacteroidota bacterium]
MTHLQKTILLTGMITICIGIILGAFGAHGLKEKISLEKLNSFETGVKYQMYHGLAFLVLAFLVPNFDFSVKYAFYFMLLGVILFSGSIYFLAIQEMIGLSISKILGPITPFGGLFLIISWLILIVNIFKQKVL